MTTPDQGGESRRALPGNDQAAAWAYALSRAAQEAPGLSRDTYTMTLWFHKAMLCREKAVLARYEERLRRVERNVYAVCLLIATAIFVLILVG